MDFYMGYVVELAEKKGIFDGYGEDRRILCSREKLAELFAEKYRWHIRSAVLVDVVQYRLNHPEEHLEEWGIGRGNESSCG